VSGDVSRVADFDARVAAFANLASPGVACGRSDYPIGTLAPPLARVSDEASRWYPAAEARNLERTEPEPQVEAIFPPSIAFSDVVATRWRRRRSNL
jgi:hypothetical protein